MAAAHSPDLTSIAFSCRGLPNVPRQIGEQPRIVSRHAVGRCGTAKMRELSVFPRPNLVGFALANDSAV